MRGSSPFGNPGPLLCPSCGGPLTPETRFCPNCGAARQPSVGPLGPKTLGDFLAGTLKVYGAAFLGIVTIVAVVQVPLTILGFWFEANVESAMVELLVVELLSVWREVNKNPAYAGQARMQYSLLPDLPADLEQDIDPYYVEAAAVGLFPNNGGGRQAALDDLEFYSLAGQLDGDPADLKVEDFWDLRPLERVLAKIGRI